MHFARAFGEYDEIRLGCSGIDDVPVNGQYVIRKRVPFYVGRHTADRSVGVVGELGRERGRARRTSRSPAPAERSDMRMTRAACPSTVTTRTISNYIPCLSGSRGRCSRTPSAPCGRRSARTRPPPARR